MNFHNDEWIMDRMREHYEDALKQYPENRIVGIFYQGSGNYGLDYEGSDVDTKCVLAPSLKELAESKMTSRTYVRENDEHIQNIVLSTLSMKQNGISLLQQEILLLLLIFLPL